MRPIRNYGPSVVVLITAVVVLLWGPRAIDRLAHAWNKVEVTQARRQLAETTVLGELNEAHRAIARAVEPSVVYIAVLRLVPGSDFPQRISSGSGWIYDEQGHIVTNEHVVRDAERIEVQLNNGSIREAEIVGLDPAMDVAVLRVEPGELIPAERGASADVNQGDVVFAFGSPFDFRFSMSSGIVSGLGRTAGLPIEYENFIQTDAAINPGNSGGPLTNIHGRVIGMNTAIATEREAPSPLHPFGRTEGTFAGIGLAIPVEMVEATVDQLIENRFNVKGVMGINLPVTDEDNAVGIRALGYDGRGVLILGVVPDSPADEAGLVTGDVIVAVDGDAVGAVNQLRALVATHPPGETLSLRLWRPLDPAAGTGETLELPVTLARRAELEGVRRQVWMQLQFFGFAGLETATPASAALVNAPYREGVLVTATLPGSDVAARIPVGSVITHANGVRVTAFEDLLDVLHESAGRGFELDVVRPSGEVASFEFPRRF